MLKQLLIILIIAIPNITSAADFNFMGIKNGMTIDQVNSILQERYKKVSVGSSNRHFSPTRSLMEFDFKYDSVGVLMGFTKPEANNAETMPKGFHLFTEEDSDKIFAIEVIYRSGRSTPLPTWPEAFVNVFGGEFIGHKSKNSYHFLFVDKDEAAAIRARDVKRIEDQIKFK